MSFRKTSSRISDYEKVLNSFRRSLEIDPLDAKKFQVGFEKKLPGFSHLVGSMSTLAVSQFREGVYLHPEWNPFSQRAHIRHKDIHSDALTAGFDQIFTVLTEMIELSHETSHILLWEPFLTGHWKITNRKLFIEASLCFEAYCFWYSDIIVTPHLREKMPDSEVAFSRHSVSQSQFHPDRAFKALGITDPYQILDIYLAAFLGYHSPLLTHQRNPFVRDLCRRLYTFYLNGEQQGFRFYHQLKKMGVFGDFARRFFGKKTLPSILSQHFTQINGLADPIRFVKEFARKGMRELALVSDELIQKVRMRRYLQTRAYSVHTLQYLIQNGSYILYRSKKLPVDRLIRKIEIYLEGIEMQLDELAKGKSVAKIRRNVQSLDQMYSQEIRSVLLKSDAWVSERVYISKDRMMKSKTRVLGSAVKRKSNQKELLEMTQYLLEMVSRMRPQVLPRVLKDEIPLMKLLAGCDLKRGPSSLKRWRMAFDQLLFSREVIELWSVSLSEIDPENHRFRELPFFFP